MAAPPVPMPGQVDGPASRNDRDLARQTRDALRHLHDPVALQVHPLAHQLQLDVGESAANTGKALRRRLLDAIAALQPESPTAATEAASRRHRLLSLRYAEGRDAATVCQVLAISQRQYDREHRMALHAVTSLLTEQLARGGAGAKTPPGRSDERITVVTPSPLTLASHLPAPLTSFVGRQRELTAVQELLTRVRLLTLVGPPGIGKTRLAIEAASRVAGTYADGVVFARLAPLRDATLVGSALVRTFELRVGTTRSALDTLIAHLERRQVLLLADNFEHVLPAGPLLSELLVACPRLTVLVTSRAPLHVTGEQEFWVPPLGLPERGRVLSPDVLECYEAVQLFVARARAVRPDFVLAPAEGSALAALCHRLDGLPLAIELAAARARLLSPTALLERLGGEQVDEPATPMAATSPLHHLADGPRDLPARQRTLRDAIAWSYHLLSPSDQSLFRHLAVFAGSWTLDAAQAVIGNQQGDDNEGGAGRGTLDWLEALVARSLVRPDWNTGGQPRFVLLETIREFAWEQLVAQGESDAAQARHAAYYLALAEKAAPLSLSESAWLRILETEIHNLRAALRWYARRPEVESALRLAAALYPLWLMGGHVAEGQRRLRELLEREAGKAYPAARAAALFAAALLAYFQQHYPAARRWYEESVALRRQLQDRPGLATSLSYLSMVAREQGDYLAARRLGAETLALYEELADERGIAMAMCRLAEIDHIEGNYDGARRGYERSLAVYRQVGRSPFLAWSLHHLGRLALDRGDYVTAGVWLRQALTVRRDEGDELGTLYSFAALASLAAANGEPRRALRLAGAAAALAARTGTVLQPTERRGGERWLSVARAALSPAAGTAAWAEGEAMPLEQAVAYALDQPVGTE